VAVTDVKPGSDAEEAGIQQGDLIVSVNREKVEKIADYNRIVSKLGKEDPVLLLILRKGSMLWMSIGHGG